MYKITRLNLIESIFLHVSCMQYAIIFLWCVLVRKNAMCLLTYFYSLFLFFVQAHLTHNRPIADGVGTSTHTFDRADSTESNWEKCINISSYVTDDDAMCK